MSINIDILQMNIIVYTYKTEHRTVEMIDGKLWTVER